jgi:hypothetical protein
MACRPWVWSQSRARACTFITSATVFALVASRPGRALAQSLEPRRNSVAAAWAEKDRQRALLGPARVLVRGTAPELRVDLLARWARVGRDEPVASCWTPCDLELPRATYKLRVHETADFLDGYRTVDIDEPAVVSVHPGSRSTRTVGLILGIAGPVAAVIGGSMSLIAMGHDSEPSDGSVRATLAYTGLGLVAAGIIVTPIGWIVFATAGTPGVTVTPGHAPTTLAGTRAALPVALRWSTTF